MNDPKPAIAILLLMVAAAGPDHEKTETHETKRRAGVPIVQESESGILNPESSLPLIQDIAGDPELPPPIEETPKVNPLYARVKAFYEAGGSQWFEVGVANTVPNVIAHLVEDHGYTRAELSGFDLNTLNWIHGMAHEGEARASVRYEPDRTVRSADENCPDGVCPDQRYGTGTRRKGLFFNLFSRRRQ